MCGRAYDPRFLFAWPNAKAAVMGPDQLTGALSIVARQSAQARGQSYDEESDRRMRNLVEYKIEQESAALYLSGMLYDDGVIDPRDTRTALGLCLAVVSGTAGTRHPGPPAAASVGAQRSATALPRYGVFRI
jgi:acetyl-CoA carboxylase carboxyltransferase component